MWPAPPRCGQGEVGDHEVGTLRESPPEQDARHLTHGRCRWRSISRRPVRCGRASC